MIRSYRAASFASWTRHLLLSWAQLHPLISEFEEFSTQSDD